ncbi:uncharacterized protein LOC106066133 isoform X2 [Biomphalaria glabrata]|uniref:Uncharacterized protein LOC106066133 isoform X2 n=1 Tax=Biomphalaria glabrata TaxID=6526 RepID=A0A9W2YV62_BIOGL|nr:uncharacterized protein LOC106066133 isoform X2 [Biomphalaria glabrata]
MDQNFTLEGAVQLNQIVDKAEGYINMEWRGNESMPFEIYDTVSLATCGSSSNLTCTKEDNVYKLRLTTLAKSNLNQSSWRIWVKYNEVEFSSVPIKLMNIFDLSKFEMRLNGQSLSSRNSSLSIKEEEEITLCCDFAPSPREAVITVNHSKRYSNLSCVTYRPRKSDKTKYMFGCVICGNGTFSQKYSIEIEDVKNGLGDWSEANILLAAFVPLCLFVFIFLVICWCKVRSSFCKSHLPVKRQPDIPEKNVSSVVLIPESMSIRERPAATAKDTKKNQ